MVRTGGYLPPLLGVRKHVDGERGWTTLGPLPLMPFDVVGSELRYRAPLQAIVDVVEPAGGGFNGRTLVRGREVGRFRLVRRR